MLVLRRHHLQCQGEWGVCRVDSAVLQVFLVEWAHLRAEVTLVLAREPALRLRLLHLAHHLLTVPVFLAHRAPTQTIPRRFLQAPRLLSEVGQRQVA